MRFQLFSMRLIKIVTSIVAGPFRIFRGMFNTTQDSSFPRRGSHQFLSGSIFILLILGFAIPLQAHAGWFDDLTNRIFDRTSKIDQLKKEIDTYKAAAEQTHQEATTLDSAVKELTGTKNKISSKISDTQSTIDSTQTKIESLEQQIADAEAHIKIVEQSIGEAIRTLQIDSDRSLAEMILGPSSLSVALANSETLSSVQGALASRKKEIAATRDELAATKSELNGKKQNLLSLKDTLADQKKAVETTEKEKASLLAQTKNKESEYQRLIVEKVAQEEEFESELNAYQSQLKGTVDQNSLPSQGTGVLAWPVENPVITQQFGMTAFAQTARAYNKSIGHNGIDLKASIGTPIMAAESGTVMGTGNTDLGCPRSSYGKWILIKHENGLATIYGHLSYIKVATGQQVSRGEVIALSGVTGYATGPHLHFGVLAADVAQVGPLRHADGSVSSCGPMPIAPLEGYLNPINYL